MEPNRFPGAASTVIRLALLSIVVGVVLSALNIRPQDLVLHLRRFVDFIYSMGFGAVEWAFGYLLLGAVVVIPIWLVSRLIAGFSGRRDDRR